MSTPQEIAELYVEELTQHPAKYGLDLWLSKGYTFGRSAVRPRGSQGPHLSTALAPRRPRHSSGSPHVKPRRNGVNSLVDNLGGVRVIVADMRRRGATPAAVQHYIVTMTPFTLRKVFSACSDAFERACYAATSTT